MWRGEYGFVLRKLVLKDFRIRYRNMSLGVFWSLVNPLVTMAILTFVFARIFKNAQPHFPVFVLCGLLPFNFFSIAWGAGTGSLIDSAALIKRVPMPRDVIPVASVLSCCLHFLIQLALLMVFVIAAGLGVNVNWLWLPILVVLEVVFVVGLSMATAALNVVVRDTRYVVEALNALLFWLVPITYPLSLVPVKFLEIYKLNPLAALSVAFRNILIENRPPAFSLLSRMTLVSFLFLGVGWFTFRKLKGRFYNYV